MDEDTRAQLDSIFRDELADHVDTIDRQRAIMRKVDLPEPELRAAIGEIYRAAHTLKGAAQAVGHGMIAGACHALEEVLGAARSGESFDRDALLRAVEDALVRIRPARAPEASQPTAEPLAEAGSAATPSGSPTATVRIDVAAIKMLGRSVQELSTMLGTSRIEGEEERGISDALSRLGDRLRETRGMLVGSPELAPAQHALGEIVETVGGLRRSVALRRLQRTTVDAAAKRRIDELSEVMRELRLTSARALRISLEQVALEAGRELGKTIVFECVGEDARIDREVLDRIKEPLTHLVRNAVDHGIEAPERRRELGKPAEGRVHLQIRTDGAEAVFVLADDGAGFDVDALLRAPDATESGPRPRVVAPLERAFVPGVTTRGEATATSGRGMGLSIVRESIAAVQGSVDLRSHAGAGAQMELRVPIQLNAIEGLVVAIDGTELTIPATSVDRIARPEPDDLRIMEGGTWLSVDDELLPIVLLPGGGSALSSPRERRVCVVLGRGRRRVALWVDAVRDMRPVLARPLRARALGSPCVRAATIQTDGSVGLVLDVAAVMHRAKPAPAEADRPTREMAPARLLVVDDSITTRQLVRVVLESAGYRVTLAADGEAAWRLLRQDGPFDMVVSDIDMPHLDGLALLARIRATPAIRDLPVVLVTALEQDEDRRRALEMGADAYVGKSSFDQSTLLDRIRDLLS